MGKTRRLEDIISDNIQIYRKQYHLTQAELAEKLGVSVSHIANIEGKKSCASLNLIQKILDHFQISPNDLLLDKDTNADFSTEERINTILSEQLDIMKSNAYNQILELFKEHSADTSYSTPVRGRRKIQTVADSEKNN